MAGSGSTEEGEVERQADLRASRLAIDPAVERQELIEGGLLEVDGVQDGEVRKGRSSPGGHDDPGPVRLRRRDAGSAVGPPEPDRVAVDLGVRETLGIGLARVFQTALELDLLDLDRGRDADVTKPGWSSRLTVMNTGASVSPSSFVQPGTAAITSSAAARMAL